MAGLVEVLSGAYASLTSLQANRAGRREADRARVLLPLEPREDDPPLTAAIRLRLASGPRQ